MIYFELWKYGGLSTTLSSISTISVMVDMAGGSPVPVTSSSAITVNIAGCLPPVIFVNSDMGLFNFTSPVMKNKVIGLFVFAIQKSDEQCVPVNRPISNNTVKGLFSDTKPYFIRRGRPLSPSIASTLVMMSPY